MILDNELLPSKFTLIQNPIVYLNKIHFSSKIYNIQAQLLLYESIICL